MRALGLFLLLLGCLVLLWPWYGHIFFRFPSITRGDTQLYGGAALMGGVVMLIVGRIRAG